MNASDKAFLVLMAFENENGVQHLESGGPGITLLQYAAIKLRVPHSDDPELDAMIRESRRADFMQVAMKISVDKCMSWPDSLVQGDWRNYLAGESGRIADAMLAEWEKDSGK
jgi:hypothetical protein